MQIINQKGIVPVSSDEVIEIKKKNSDKKSTHLRYILRTGGEGFLC